MVHLTVKELARDISAGGVPLDTARARAVSYAQNGFIRIRASGPRTVPNEFSAYDSAAAIVLSQIQDAGVADHDTLREASRALYEWPVKSGERDAGLILPGEHYLPQHPIERVIQGINRRESWSLVINFWRDMRTGVRLVDADLYRSDQSFIGRPDIGITATPRGAVIVVLDEAMLPILLRVPAPGSRPDRRR
ncbi:MAG: hypothetical protein BGN87_22580 [Rhizobiales bacterium 65-79]|jgi:hypothetical protein|nr:hypothetical protein [Hyphomicrobiales bacterium]OJU00111.1 MAG: hypothetical protein BGN87_22580 [Rhizobiales bacterium 65-79]